MCTSRSARASPRVTMFGGSFPTTTNTCIT
jgi:hypothetical protein